MTTTLFCLMTTTLHFLGTSAATPIPYAGCACAQCTEARDAGTAHAAPLHRARSALLIEGSGGALLVDAGPDIYQQLARLPELPWLGAAIITHAHSDHYLGLDDLSTVARTNGWLTDRGGAYSRLLPIYAPPDNWPRIEATFGHLFQSGDFQCLEARTLLLDRKQEIVGFNVLPFDSSHTTGFTTAMLSFTLGGKRVVYASDIKVMPRKIFAGADIAIINGTFYERDHPAHMPLLKGMRTCQRLGVGRIIATHIGHLEWSNAELWARLSEHGADLAYDGATLTFE
jgi:phosphoribosyl 1,2-cyclic phosphate phosphodiesterase